MKVLLINPEHALLGGAHTVYLNTGDMLRQAGVDVVFFAMHCDKEIPCEQSAFFAKPNNRRDVLKYVRNSFYNRDAAMCLQRLIDKERPDIAHIHLMWGSLSPSILDVLKKNGIPVVHTVHDYAMLCSRATLKGNDGAVCEKCAGGHYCQSIKTRCSNGSALKGAISALEMNWRNKKHHPVDFIDHFLFVSHFCAVKHCEMDLKFKDAAKTVLYNIPDRLVVKIAQESVPDTYDDYYLYYGRLAYEKGIGTLIEAFKDKPNIQLKVVGTGPIEKSLKEKCSSLNIKNVEFLGFKSGEELYHIVQNAKYVCVPSEWYENNPMTIIEAYTLSTPMVAARIGGIPEIVEDQSTGFLFQPGDVESLKSTIDKCESLTKEAYYRMKSNAQNFAKVKFEREKYVQRLCAIYEQVINTYRKKSIWNKN
jgi:glycosyltransferase involved in cell wall biosynthesis